MTVVDTLNAQYEKRKSINEEMSTLSKQLDTYLQTNANMTISELYKLIVARDDMKYVIATISSKEMQRLSGKVIYDKIGSMVLNAEIQSIIVEGQTGSSIIEILNTALQDNWDKGYSLVHRDYDVNKLYRRIKKLRTESNMMKTNMNSFSGKFGGVK